MGKLKTFCAALFALCLVGTFVQSSYATGKHYGELKMIEANIVFDTLRGVTVADSNGLTLIVDGLSLPGPKIVYAQQFWGTYPMYYPGDTCEAVLRIKNLGPRAIAKHDVVASTFMLNEDGSLGPLINEKPPYHVEVPLGETIVYPVQFEIPFMPKPLYIMEVKLYHDSGDAETLIMTERAIFCPPEAGVWDLATKNGVDASELGGRLVLFPGGYAYSESGGCSVQGSYKMDGDLQQFTPSATAWGCLPLSAPGSAHFSATPATLTMTFEGQAVPETWIFVRHNNAAPTP